MNIVEEVLGMLVRALKLSFLISFGWATSIYAVKPCDRFVGLAAEKLSLNFFVDIVNKAVEDGKPLDEHFVDLYNFKTTNFPLSSEISEKTKNAESSARYFLEDFRIQYTDLSAPEFAFLADDFGIDPKTGKPPILTTYNGRIGTHEFQYSADNGDEDFAYTNIRIKTKSTKRTFKVYIPINPNLMKEELPKILKTAEESNAFSFKFHPVISSPRNDRIIAYFETAEETAAFADKIAKDFESRGIQGDTVPMAAQVRNAPVFIGTDIRGEGSWRVKVSTSIAQAAALIGRRNPGRLEAIGLLLRADNIDPSTWLPVDAPPALRNLVTP